MKKLILIAFAISLLLPIQALSQIDNKKDRFSERLMQERFSRNNKPNAQINRGTVDNDIPDFRNTGNSYPNQIIFSPQSLIYVVDTALIIWAEDEYNPADTSRYLYTFNVGAKRTLGLKQRLIDGSWMNDIRNTSTYDASNNMITDLWEWWENGEWINGYRHTYTYDNQSNMLTDLNERWENNQLVNVDRDTYTYDVQGNRLTRLFEICENSQWINSENYIYTYDAQGNMLTWTGQNWENNQWVNNWRVTCTYNAQGNMLTELSELWNGQWENIWFHTYTYDAQGNMLTDLNEWWENNQWVNCYRSTYTYDIQGNMLTSLGENWENGQWINSEYRTFTYDSQGNTLTELIENWQNAQWINSWLITFAYDTQGNLTSFWLYTWFESSWIPANVNNYSGFVMYDTAGNEYHFWGHNFTFTYKLIVTGIMSESTDLIEQYILRQNYPNPFNPATKIKYSIPQSSQVVIKVFDVLGNEIETLVNEEKPAGNYELTWNAENLPSGVYFYRLQAGSFIETKKMVLMK